MAEAKKTEIKKEVAEELVEVYLFKDNNKYKDDVLVGCNGEFIQIKRGENVKIPRKFAEILEHSKRQDLAATKVIEKAISQADQKLADL